MSKIPKFWNSLVYFVALPKRNGSAPGIEKAIQDSIFTNYVDAKNFLIDINKMKNDNYGIFVAEVKVPRIGPVDREVANDLDYRVLTND